MEKAFDLIGESRTFERVQSCFDQIEICEEIISSFRGHPNFYYINKGFRAYRSDIVTSDYPTFLFKNHCKEIAYRLSQIHNGLTKKLVYDRMKIPTKAEMCILGKESTLVSRLNREVEDNLLYMFRQILDEENIDDPSLDDIKGTLNEYFLDEMFECYKDEDRAKIVWELVKGEQIK